jgi:hypothetical protein
MNESIDSGELAPGDTISILFDPISMVFPFTNGSYWARTAIMTDRGTQLEYSEHDEKIVAALNIDKSGDYGRSWFNYTVDTIGVGYVIQIQGRGYGNLDFQVDLEVFTRPYQALALPLIGLGLLVIIVAFVWHPASRTSSALGTSLPPPPPK